MSSSTRYKVHLSNDQAFDIAIDADGELTLNGEVIQPDIVATGSASWHLLLDNQSYSIELLPSEGSSKQLLLSINGEEFDVEVKDELDGLLSKMGMSGSGSSKMGDVRAPMPGLVLKLLVAPGDEVEPGDALVILEAMKMENIIKATGKGVVKNVLVGNQDTVDKNQILIEMQ